MALQRKIGSIKNELATKAREAMLSTVQIYNNPNIQFKAETFIVLSIIAWTYLMHAYYRQKKIDYCYYQINNNGHKKYEKTKYGAKKHWELERCINYDKSPLDEHISQNLRFLIGLRHEIEHLMTSKIDDALSAKFQACCINFNKTIVELIDSRYAIDKHLSFSLQFTSLSEPHIEQLEKFDGLPKHIESYITNFDEHLDDDIFNSPKYSYRILFVPKSVNKRGQADKVIEFIPKDLPLANQLNKEYYLIKEKEKTRYLPSQLIKIVKAKGYTKLNMYHFIQCWKSKNTKRDNTYGCIVCGKECIGMSFFSYCRAILQRTRSLIEYNNIKNTYERF